MSDGRSGLRTDNAKENPDTTSAKESLNLVCATKTMDTREAEAVDHGNSNPPKLLSSTFTLKKPLVWIDLEMTGLKIENDRILEIACIITDGKLDKMVQGPDLIINQPEECLQNMDQWCQEHHTSSGLVEQVRRSNITEKEAEKEVLELVLKHCPRDKQCPDRVYAHLAGNSVYTDFFFLKKYMPSLAEVFPHVIVDVSSIRTLCFRWLPEVNYRAPPKKRSHRAFDDIKESITELKYFQKNFFRDFSARGRPDLSGHPNRALHNGYT